eukprot:GHUV01007724.1.p1 GENE.GHUV01007724.1~~GHUV01007724.1.p1  ORF type:complete len:336 (+),score=52.69 GHUV01007724.1:260-1267(+)
MQGTLFKYGPGSAHIAFKHALSSSKQPPKPSSAPGSRYIVLVGGLTDGLLFAPYCQQLADTLTDWTLVQAQLTSSYQGWGLASLDQDAAELKLLSDCLAADHGCVYWVLMGHSTGCQDAVRYVQQYQTEDPRLAGVILQAPVSDREYFGMYPSWSQHIKTAQETVKQGRGEEVVCRASEWDGAAVTARRLVSLACKGGDDDMFSTDLTLEQLRDILGPLQGLPTLIIQSGEDESVPESLRSIGSITSLGQRMVQAIEAGPKSVQARVSTKAVDGQLVVPHSAERDVGQADGVQAQHRRNMENCVQLRVVEGAGHACKGYEAQLVDLVCEFLPQVR